MPKRFYKMAKTTRRCIECIFYGFFFFKHREICGSIVKSNSRKTLDIFEALMLPSTLSYQTRESLCHSITLISHLR